MKPLRQLANHLRGRREVAESTQERWARVSEIVDEALRRPEPRERARYLEEACAGEPALLGEVEELLRYEDIPSGFLAGPLFGRDMSPEPELPPTLAPGQTVGQYRIEKLLGDGGMGTVALAYDPVLDRRVALKVIRRDRVSEETLHRFETERRVLARLEHPAIARLFDAGTLAAEDGSRLPWFSLEYVDGEPIDVFCARRRLGIDARLRLVLEVCDALAEAHRHLVVHRDLKPGNVLVTAAGQPKLLDFGIAKELDPLAGAADLTRTGRQPLTPAWASPEQVRGLPVGVTTDVYSLGLLLYQLLCGEPPYLLDGDGFENLRRICEEEPSPPSGRAPGFRWGGDLDAIALRALAKEPGQRYGSIADLAEDLRRYLAGLPVEARRATLGYRTAKLVRRRWRELLAAVLVVGSLVVGLGVWLASRAHINTVETEGRRAAEQAEQAEREAEALSSFAQGLVLGADPDAGGVLAPGKMLARALVQARRNLAGEPEALAHQLEALGLAHRALGELEPARALIGESLRLRRQVYGRGDHRLVARSLNNLGSVVHAAGDPHRAERLYRLALAMKQRLGQGAPELARVENNLASILAALGELAEAEALYRRVLEVRRNDPEPDPAEVASSLRSLGNMLYLAGDFAAAETSLREALALREHEHGAESTRTAAVWSSLGRVLHAQGRFGEAKAALENALAVRLSRLPEGHLYVALTRKDLASVCFDLGENERAERLWAQAMPVLRAEQGAEAWELADADSQLGARLMAAGRLGEAAPLLESSYETLRRTRGERSLHTRQARSRLEQLERRQGIGKPQ